MDGQGGTGAIGIDRGEIVEIACEALPIAPLPAVDRDGRGR